MTSGVMINEDRAKAVPDDIVIESRDSDAEMFSIKLNGSFLSFDLQHFVLF